VEEIRDLLRRSAAFRTTNPTISLFTSDYFLDLWNKIQRRFSF
jgi:hypothetical protein